ncbi:MAG: 2-hydroxyacyl-CoA dehydratase [Syntrophaceae bacterium]|nr:2-hydroxyacyl-CoA dehydratase [Syntrophaceae bacterium]
MIKMLISIKALIIRLPEIIKGLWQDSLIKYLISVENPVDALTYMKYWIINYYQIGKLQMEMILKLGPAAPVRMFIRYPWMLTLLWGNRLMRRYGQGRTGRYLESVCLTLHSINSGIGDTLRQMFLHPDRLVITEDLLPLDIVHAMGLFGYQLEGMGIVLPLIDSSSCEKYIDEAENEGMNPDSCSLPKTTVGMVLKGQMPKGLAMISSNLPCDAGAASYAFFQRIFNIPTYRLDVPYNFFNERAENLFIEDVKGMIAFLEKHTPGRMDWERFRKICKNRNRMLELELELWDMMRVRPAPLAAEAVWLSHLWHYNVSPDYEESTRLFENIVSLARKNLEENIPATRNERFRTIIWNPPLLHFSHIINWAERTYGLTVINDSMTYHHHLPVDTSTPDSMLRGWSRIIMQGPMVRHTRGPAENYMDDIFRAYKQFDLDMVWIANHVGCKGGQAMNGILRERCREKGIPLLILDYDLNDPRIVSHDNMKRQVEHFMNNVMKAPRLDQ